MKNIIDQKPTDFSRGHYSRFTFVDKEDIRDQAILDIGCGYGWFESLSLKDGAKQITGMEVTEEDLLTAKKYISSKKVNFIVGSAVKLPFKNNSFDTVVSWEVLEHIPKSTEAAMFEEVKRVLKPGGVFYFSTPYSHPISNFTDPAWVLFWGKHRHYKLSDIEKYAEEAGFKIEALKVKGGYVTIISVLNMYFSKWVLRRKPLFSNSMDKIVERDLNSDRNKIANIYCKLSAKDE